MKKIFYILIIFFFSSPAQSHSTHYKGIVKIEMEVFRNNKLIGYSNYYFEHEKDVMTIKNYTQFKVKLLGIIIFMGSRHPSLRGILSLIKVLNT